MITSTSRPQLGAWLTSDTAQHKTLTLLVSISGECSIHSPEPDLILGTGDNVTLHNTLWESDYVTLHNTLWDSDYVTLHYTLWQSDNVTLHNTLWESNPNHCTILF